MALSRLLVQDVMNTRTSKNKLFTKLVIENPFFVGWNTTRKDMLLIHPQDKLNKDDYNLNPEASILLDNKLYIKGSGFKPSIKYVEEIEDFSLDDYLTMSNKLREKGFRFNKKTRELKKCTK